jgi:hypothetical protein
MRSLTAFRVLLDLHLLDGDEKARADLVGAILKQAPKSQLYANSPTVQAEVKNLGVTYDAFTSTGSQAAATAKQLKSDVAAHVKAREANNKSLNLLRTLTENGATEPKDIQDMAFVPYTGKPTPIPLDAPALIVQKPSKKGSGKTEAAVYETGRTRQRYAAECSPNGVDGWVAQIGAGKSRKLTGKPGTSVWIRFALQRGGQQSPWSAPFQVTFP